MLAYNFSKWLLATGNDCRTNSETLIGRWIPLLKSAILGKLSVSKSLSARLPEPFVYMSLYFCEERTCLFQNISNAKYTWQCTCKMSWNFMCETYCAKVTKICWLSKQCSFSIRPTWGWTFTLSKVACFFRTREDHIFMLAEDSSLHGKKWVCSTTILWSVGEI